MVLGGVPIPFNRHLVGHSDADVLLHSLTDAILGALAEGDIGEWFPDTAAENKGRDSKEMLQVVLRKARGGRYPHPQHCRHHHGRSPETLSLQTGHPRIDRAAHVDSGRPSQRESQKRARRWGRSAARKRSTRKWLFFWS